MTKIGFSKKKIGMFRAKYLFELLIRKVGLQSWGNMYRARKRLDTPTMNEDVTMHRRES
jgi:hypothetical protein